MRVSRWEQVKADAGRDGLGRQRSLQERRQMFMECLNGYNTLASCFGALWQPTYSFLVAECAHRAACDRRLLPARVSSWEH